MPFVYKGLPRQERGQLAFPSLHLKVALLPLEKALSSKSRLLCCSIFLDEENGLLRSQDEILKEWPQYQKKFFLDPFDLRLLLVLPLLLFVSPQLLLVPQKFLLVFPFSINQKRKIEQWLWK